MSTSAVGPEASGLTEPRWRLFLAAALSEAVGAELAPALAGLAALARLVRPNRLDAIHLTLHFLGEVDHARREVLNSGLRGVVHRFEPFDVFIAGVGGFPSMTRPRVIWAGVTGPERTRLIDLQAATAAPLLDAGFVPEARAYSPHLTLGRLRAEGGREERQALARWAKRWEGTVFGVLRVDVIHLVRSELSVRPPRYTMLESFPLQ